MLSILYKNDKAILLGKYYEDLIDFVEELKKIDKKKEENKNV